MAYRNPPNQESSHSSGISQILSLPPMGTLGLRSNDPLRRPQLHQSPNPNARSSSCRPRRRRRSPTAARRALVPENPSPSPAKKLVMGQVRILKRGENLAVNPKAVAGADLVLSSAGWIGPDPDVVRRNVRVSDLYAGAACLPSPPPSSLPFPATLVRGGTRRVI